MLWLRGKVQKLKLYFAALMLPLCGGGGGGLWRPVAQVSVPPRFCGGA